MRIQLLYITLIAMSALSTEACRADEIVLGVSTSMSGPFAPFGQGVSDGARLAVDKINEHGGISGKKVHLFIYDDQCNPAVAVEVTQRLIMQDKVAALIGYPCGVTALAALPIAAKNNVLSIEMSGAPIAKGSKSGPVLHMLDSRLPITVADYMKNNFGDKQIGLWLPEPSPPTCGTQLNRAA